MGQARLSIRLFGASRLPPAARRPRLIAAACRAALGARARAGGELAVVFVGRRRMRSLNRRFLRRDYDTDVLAFAYPPAAAPRRGAAGPFGDVFISVDQARRQARELGHPLLREVATLAVHGALHLLGHRDERPAERARMSARQDAVVRRVLR